MNNYLRYFTLIAIILLSSISFSAPVRLVPSGGKAKPYLVLLLYGTWNNSDFSTIINALESEKIPYIECNNYLLGTGLTLGQLKSTDCATEIYNMLVKECDNTRGVEVIDVVAHSFGGLVARRIAQLTQGNPHNSFLIRNVITCGTPLGGLNSVENFSTISGFPDGILFPQEMAAEHMQQNSAIYENVKGVEYEGVHYGINYWEIGGRIDNPDKWVMRLTGLSTSQLEPKPRDGWVSAQSVAGIDPSFKNVAGIDPKLFLSEPPPDTDSRRYFDVDHGGTVSDNNIVHHYIMPVIMGGTFPPLPKHETINLAMVIDVSGSMGENAEMAVDADSKNSMTKLAAAVLASNRLLCAIQAIKKSDNRFVQLSLIPYAGTENVLVKNDEYFYKMLMALDSLTPGGGTNMRAGLNEGISILAESQDKRNSYQNEYTMILLSDGEPNIDNEGGDCKANILAKTVVTAQHRKIPINTVAICDREGRGADVGFMEEIARRTGGQALRTSDVLDLSSSFVSLFFDVCALQKNTDWRGRIAQGERKYVAGIFVPPFTQRLDATALWMGSEVDLELVPFGRGRMAGGTRSHGIQYISRRSPRPGFYRVHLYGREIPEGGEDCRVIVGVTPSLMQHDAWGYLLIGLLIVPFLLFRALRAVDQGAT